MDGHAWRYLLAAPLTLGLLFGLPLAMAGRTVRFLRREPAWAYFIVATFLLALVGGRDDDRYVYVLAPALVVLTFVATGRAVWSSRWRLTLLTALHLVAVRFLWPVGPTEADYLQYTVAFMPIEQLQLVAIVGAAALLVAFMVIHAARVSALFRRIAES